MKSAEPKGLMAKRRLAKGAGVEAASRNKPRVGAHMTFLRESEASY